jgi:hypothetical protein
MMKNSLSYIHASVDYEQDEPWPVRLTISRQTPDVNMKSMQALLLKQALFKKHPI